MEVFQMRRKPLTTISLFDSLFRQYLVGLQGNGVAAVLAIRWQGTCGASLPVFFVQRSCQKRNWFCQYIGLLLYQDAARSFITRVDFEV